jgi:hypothetical protein
MIRKPSGPPQRLCSSRDPVPQGFGEPVPAVLRTPFG